MGFFARIVSFIFWVGVVVVIFSPGDGVAVVGRLITIVATVLGAMVVGFVGILNGA